MAWRSSCCSYPGEYWHKLKSRVFPGFLKIPWGPLVSGLVSFPAPFHPGHVHMPSYIPQARLCSFPSVQGLLGTCRLQPPLLPLLQTAASTAHPAYGATPWLSLLEVPLILVPAGTLASRSKLPLVLQPKGLELSRWLFKEIASFPVLCPEALISGHQ